MDIKEVKEKIEQFEESTLENRLLEYSTQVNTSIVRDQYLKLAHYTYILKYLGDDSVETQKHLDQYISVAREKIEKARDSETKKRQTAELYLIDQHIKAWNMAEYYYERASKTLCQMMVTIMDYIIQEKASLSILYKEKEKGSYFSLLDEIIELNKEYEKSYYFLCAYDFCTEKIADIINIKEYKDLPKEHIRLVENGIPQKVRDSIMVLKEIAGEEKAEYFIDIERAFNEKPKYSETLFNECYEDSMKVYQDDNNFMTYFSAFVVVVDDAYEEIMIK